MHYFKAFYINSMSKFLTHFPVTLGTSWRLLQHQWPVSPSRAQTQTICSESEICSNHFIHCLKSRVSEGIRNPWLWKMHFTVNLLLFTSKKFLRAPQENRRREYFSSQNHPLSYGCYNNTCLFKAYSRKLVIAN